ncbi:pilus assembly protein [Noviherbaspirillum sp.]|uniref:pilus assembly protein n=1 Tax=Noviherbaspirillum sp. TaxID=1926288 RepID=UPI002FE2EE6A
MNSFLLRALQAPLLSLLLLLPSAFLNAATTDIANSPMANSSSAVVKPNVMFILDDSGSMTWSYLGDSVYANGYQNKIGYRSHLCNKAYYNPNVTYALPVNADGTNFTAPSFNAAYFDGFKAGSVTVNLSTNFMAWRSNNSDPKTPAGYSEDCWKDSNSCTPGGSNTLPNSGEPAYYFVYKGNKQANLGDNSNNDHCKDHLFDTSTSGNKNWYKVVVGSSSGPNASDERQNFANWYSFYRTRIMAMKSAAGLAFKSIDNNYRIGLNTINYTGTNNSDSRFLSINDFNDTHRATWYSKLYGTSPSGGTPLRDALSKAGRMYAGQFSTIDPVQYSCQQNFAILSTDGYWNGGDGYQINGSTNVGNQDGGTTLRPLFDSANVANTLADVAMYYYKTDLRTDALSNCTGVLGNDVCENNVPGSGDDVNSQQHMTTFTLGLGVNGTLTYSDNYQQGGSSDFNQIIQGTKNWPAPQADKPTAIDDLWHAAVNGRGTYFSAQNPDSLVSGITKALAGVTARKGAASAAATSNLQPVAGDNFAYVALYRTVKWDGDLEARPIDPGTGEVSATKLWAAQPLLDSKVSALSDTRTIYTQNGSTGSMKLFTWANLTSAEQAHFNNICGATPKLSQCSVLDASQKSLVSGLNLVNFIRGQSGFEDESSNPATNRIFRDREHVLGDMVGSQPVYLKKPPFQYVDDNFSAFKSDNENRQAMVYVGANDGMLHAFNAVTGVEEWAYIPPMVMPNLYKLAEKNYGTNHQYFTDGSPNIGDICPNAPSSSCSKSQWKSILVAGMNAGGRGYYALDITNPATPKPLWNFTVATDSDLGYTFGNPVITKRKDGTWVVAFTSGYNNVSPGNGIGYLYILNANTGALLEKISTNTGSTGTPSGLGKLNAWVDSIFDNTAERFYAGDLLGNVWRFDIDNVVPPTGKEATLIAELGQVAGAGVQSITTKPLLAEIYQNGVRYPIVQVATGKYLGLTDLVDTSQQSVYAFKDKLTETGLGKVRTGGTLVKQTLSSFSSNGQAQRTTSTVNVAWANDNGWYVDLNPNNESPGERVNVDMQQQLGMLIVAANVPNTNACNIGGESWIYYFDYETGQFLKSSAGNMVGQKLKTNAMVAGITVVQNGGGGLGVIITDTGGNIVSGATPPGTSVNAKRVSWRELID